MAPLFSSRLWQAVQQQADSAGGSAKLISHDHDRAVPLADVVRLATALGGAIAAAVPPDAPDAPPLVGVCCGSRLEYIVAVLAALCAG